MSLYDDLIKCRPSLERGMVWCTVCGQSQKTDVKESFRSGWPKCCGFTMSIDSPEEREQLSNC